MTTTRTLFSTLLILALPLFMLGCDGGGSAMEEMQMEELTLTIKNGASSKARTNGPNVTRDVSGNLEEGDLVNVFVRDGELNNSQSRTKVEVPSTGGERTVSFTVPATPDGEGEGYTVELVGYTPEDANVSNSVILAATTADGAVDVDPGQVTEVDFRTNDDTNAEDASLFTRFDFDFDLEVGLTAGEEENNVSLDVSKFEQFIGQSGGGIGIDPDEITVGDIGSALTTTNPFTLDDGTLSTDPFTLPLNDYRENDDGEVSILLELPFVDRLETSGQTLSIFNNVDGSAATNVPLGGDGGVIVIF